MCLGLALWNGRDPILKERLFGLTNHEGNHGEDVKECYYYLDATPTHSYLKMLYKYPQQEFPYARLVEENRRRGRDQPEFELLDTGIFDDNRYFDVFVEYAKAAPDDMLMLVTVHNRGPETGRAARVAATLVQQYLVVARPDRPSPACESEARAAGRGPARSAGRYHWYAECATPTLLFCENETNARGCSGSKAEGYFKDAFHDYRDRRPARRRSIQRSTAPRPRPTTCSRCRPAEPRSIRLRLGRPRTTNTVCRFRRSSPAPRARPTPFTRICRRALPIPTPGRCSARPWPGMIWSKQFYHYDVPQWLEGDPAAADAARQRARQAATAIGRI